MEVLTASLIPQVQWRAIIWPATNITHFPVMYVRSSPSLTLSNTDTRSLSLCLSGFTPLKLSSWKSLQEVWPLLLTILSNTVRKIMFGASNLYNRN